jgi:hypothetical protein
MAKSRESDLFSPDRSTAFLVCLNEKYAFSASGKERSRSHPIDTAADHKAIKFAHALYLATRFRG